MTILVHRLIDKGMANATGQENLFPLHACRDIGSSGCPWDHVFRPVNGVEYNLRVSAALRLHSIAFYTALATTGKTTYSWSTLGSFFGFLAGHRVCPPLNKLENGFIYGQQNWEGEWISFSCRSGYWLRGPSERHCLSIGSRTGKQPNCPLGKIF